MTNPFNVNDGAKRLVDAANRDDGISTSRILEEAGSCNWKDLVAKANSDLQKTKLGTHDELRINNVEQLTLYKIGNSQNGFGNQLDDRVQPLATVSDVRCDRK